MTLLEVQIPHCICLLMSVFAVVTAQNSPITFQLAEQLPSDRFIGNVAQASGLESTMSADEFQNLRYQILSSDGLRITSMIYINSVTGELFTNAMIDREQICDTSIVTCKLQFDVMVRSGQSVIRLLNVIVEILDINDNPPSFPSRQLPLTISEDSPVGSEFRITGAVDRDTGLDATIYYWMDNNDIFGLREERLLDSSVLYLALKQKLDRETEDSYELRIYAKDGNTSAALTGTLSVLITVGDFNDHDPEFTQTTYNFTVKENATPGNYVGKIEASDLDIGFNGQITYNFSSLTSSRILTLFRLDSSNGDIFVHSALQYESNQEFRAVVEAKDKGSTPRTSQANLIISVVDAGNTPPRLSLTLADLLYQDTTLLSESLPTGSFVGTLKYLDNDDGENGRVECRSLHPHFDLQSLDDSGYGIVIKALLDRETDNEFIVQLKCSDNGSPSLSSFVNFTVLVGDSNDNPPVFRSPGYTASVAERVTVANNIVKVQATDADEGENGEVTYQLTANSSNAFSVDPFSGWISLKSPVDRESGPVIRLTVLAFDNGEEPKNGSVTVTVTVEDVNDNSPEIVRTEYSVQENERQGTFVSRITAVDRDHGENGQVRFSLLSDPSNSFIVSEDGTILTTAILDRESIPYYLIVVKAQDRGSPVLSSTSTLSIIVTDTNDHPPVVTFPIPGNDSVSVSANLSPGSLVATILATDEDIGRNSKLQYLIAEGNPHRIFGMDNSTGKLFVAQRLTSVRQSSYQLTVFVQDGGNPRQHVETFLYIAIDFTNASMLDDGSDMEHKYIIIAGVISGITLVVAFVVIAIIFKLRHADIGSRSNSLGKAKADTRPIGINKDVSDYSIQTVPGFKIDQTDRDAGFDPDRTISKDSTSSFSPHGGSSSIPYSQRNTMTQDYVNRHSGHVYPVTSNSRQRLNSEDIHSNTSNETTTSDSGRGGSDVEETTNAALSPQATHPNPTYVPTIPPREPLGVTMATPSDVSSFQPLAYTGDAKRDFLSRAARAYASHKEQSRKAASKVRFSFDDNAVGNSPRFLHPSSASLAIQTPSPIEANIKPSSLPTAQGSAALNDLSYSSGFSSAASTRSADGRLGLGDRGHQRLLKPPYYQDGVAKSRDAHRFHPSTTGGIPAHLAPSAGSRSTHSNPNYEEQFNNGHHVTKKDSSYPLLRPPVHSRSTLSSLNHSVDEDDDDGGSTTTSGSYAIDDNMNISVDC